MDKPLQAMARKVVRDSLRVNESDIVVINTWDWTSDIATALALECFKVNADVLMTLYSDDFYFGHLEILSEEDLRQTSRHCLELADYASVEIFVGSPQAHSRFQDISPGKLVAQAQGEKVHMAKNRERRIRTALPEFSVVHPKVAKTYRLNYSGWKKMMRSAVMIDYQKTSEFGTRLASRLQKGRTVRVRQGKDTDLRFKIAGRTPFIQDGAIDERDIHQGQTFTSLPAGTVAVSPIEDSVSGQVKFDLCLMRSGKLVNGIRWQFEHGRLVEFGAERNLDSVKGRWDEARGNKDRMGSLVFGINPKARFGFNVDHLAMGAVSIGLGANKDLGGGNETDFYVSCTLSRATVELDGRPIVRNGGYLMNELSE